MIIRGISFRTKLLLASLFTMIFMVAFFLYFLDASNLITAQNDMLKSRSEMLSQMRFLEQTFQRLEPGDPGGELPTCHIHLSNLETLSQDLAGSLMVAGDQHLELKLHQVHSCIDRLRSVLRIPELNDAILWKQAITDLVVMGEMVSEFDRALSQIMEKRARNHQWQMVALMVLGILLIGIVMFQLNFSLVRAFNAITSFTAELSMGKLPPELEGTREDEFGRISTHLNRLAAELRNKIDYIAALTGRGGVAPITPPAEDELGKALVGLSRTLNQKELEEVTRNREDKKQNWISEGVAQIGEVLRSERENVEELTYSMVHKLVAYMNVEMGSIFITRHTKTGNPYLELSSSYAYDRRKYLSLTLEWGEGLPGTCAREKKKIFLTEVPEAYFEVVSGTGSTSPNCILLVPMMIDNEVTGIIELATVRLLRPFEIAFVESIAERMASSILSVQTNERTAELLKQSQAQADELRNQEATLRESMRQLQEAQTESVIKESEIAGILSAINQSTLVAEMGTNGRFTGINDRFLALLETQRDQVIGKLHSELAQVDPYSGEYKEFWSSLRKGASSSNTEMYRLNSGKEIWLQQTFTPILNSEGKVHKILNIAVDITENRSLIEQLGSREIEITRRNLDLKTLNEAVNTSLIKCELDPEGIILDVNKNYTEVTGYSRKELLGRNYRLFLKDNEKSQFERIWEEVTKPKVYEGVVRRSKPTGEEVWLVSTFSPVIDEEGVVCKVYFMGLDITEKKLKYQLLEEANREIERLKERLNDQST